VGVCGTNKADQCAISVKVGVGDGELSCASKEGVGGQRVGYRWLPNVGSRHQPKNYSQL